MAALAGNASVSTYGTPRMLSFSANGADEFYAGALVFIDTSGGVQVVPAAGDRFVGISTKHQTITAATQEVEVYIGGEFEVPLGTNIAAADEGDLLIMDIGTTQSDNFADCVAATDITAAANDVIIAQIMRAKTSTMVISFSPGFAGRLYASTATNAWV